MTLNSTIAEILQPAYVPCAGFKGPCAGRRWDPKEGHVPRGFRGGAGSIDEIELVLVFAEPGDPHTHEKHTGLTSVYGYSSRDFETGRDQFHRNMRSILDACWPGILLDLQMRKVWMIESVLCSAPKEGGPVHGSVTKECGRRYLLPQLRLLPHALVVALGSKAKNRLQAIGYLDFISVAAVAPPGCNFVGAQDSWKCIPEILAGRK